MTRKTIAELEREMKVEWRAIAIIFILVSVFFIFGTKINYDRWSDSKSQLQECHKIVFCDDLLLKYTTSDYLRELCCCQEKVPSLSDISIINNSKGEYSVSVWSKNGALIQSKDPLLQKLNDLISYSNSEEWNYYVYTFEERYYIDGEEIEVPNIGEKRK